jgi:formylglycine-generating enzyme required for sulfatase activity
MTTESEWEYAARAGRPEIYYGVLRDIAWYAANSDGHAHAVGKKAPNAFGLYDMLGNVAEWVLDRYYNKYDPDAVAVGAVAQPFASNASAVARGGSWDREAVSLRVSHRVEMPNDEGMPMVGFRCACDRP